jgi:hypothetical protein
MGGISFGLQALNTEAGPFVTLFILIDLFFQVINPVVKGT